MQEFKISFWVLEADIHTIFEFFPLKIETNPRENTPIYHYSPYNYCYYRMQLAQKPVAG